MVETSGSDSRTVRPDTSVNSASLIVALQRAAEAFRDFDRSMRQVQATCRRSGKSFQGLLRVARRRGLPPVAVKPALRGRRHGW